ncbi:MAG: hypothetical protein ACO3JL_11215 [Myxococcota bacterium]
MTSLPTAPCTQCRQLVVYGQRSCMHCGTTFQYGPQAPPEPTMAQVQLALATAFAAQGGPALPPPAHGAPPPSTRVQAGPMIASDATPGPAYNAAEETFDTGRYDLATQAQVTTEAIPGFVDSTLFKAFTPTNVETEQVEGLEATGFGMVRDAPPAEFVPVETTSYGEVGLVATEAIPGFVDSTLFKAFTPSSVETEVVEGFEAGASAFSLRPARRVVAADDGTACSECGTHHQSSLCPTCGARRRGD